MSADVIGWTLADGGACACWYHYICLEWVCERPVSVHCAAGAGPHTGWHSHPRRTGSPGSPAMRRGAAGGHSCGSREPAAPGRMAAAGRQIRQARPCFSWMMWTACLGRGPSIPHSKSCVCRSCCLSRCNECLGIPGRPSVACRTASFCCSCPDVCVSPQDALAAERAELLWRAGGAADAHG